MSLCMILKDPALRYDLRNGSFREAWDEFIPSLGGSIHGGAEYVSHCASCANRAECQWCAAYAYLEHGRYSAPIAYLCELARETIRYKQAWCREHRRYYRIAGVTIQVDSDLPIAEHTFGPNLAGFEVPGPGEDVIAIRHHFAQPELLGNHLGVAVYRQPPWTIYRQGRSWVYVGTEPEGDTGAPHQIAVFSADHTRGHIYSDNLRAQAFEAGNLNSLTLFPTDQMLLARVLVDRQACYLHAAGMVFDGQGLLFVGHSEAGKSTIVTMLQAKGEILCDDRIVVRRWPDGYRIHGTWSHGDVPIVSPGEAPLRAILFLEQAAGNRLLPVADRRDVAARLLLHVIKPLVTHDWWQRVFDVVEGLVHEVPAYCLQFDRSGRVIDVLQTLLDGKEL